MSSLIAIGDIHGCVGKLNSLLAQLPSEGTLVFLGDYIDRGPDSRGVLNRLIGLASERSCVFLLGNHEQMALKASSGDYSVGRDWRANGGRATLNNYWGGKVLPEHVAFLDATVPYYTTNEYIFVHGGLEHGVPVERTDPVTLCWMREPFLSSEENWGRLVIHGHTPTRDHRPHLRPNRINLDTGAVFGGPLTALILPDYQFIYAGYTS
jgi:serine/threonine protein phosphatase 1